MVKERAVNCREAELKVRPYINDELTDEELEAFIGHIRACPSCYDELETYFTIYKTLNVLDRDEAADIDNIHRALEDDLARKEGYLTRHHRRQETFGMLIMIAEIMLIFCIFMQYFGNGDAFFIQLWHLLGF